MKQLAYTIIIILSLGLLNTNSAQFSRNEPTIHQSAISAEYLGNAGIYSLNFERMTNRTAVRWTNFRVGISYLNDMYNDKGSLIIPLEYDWLWGNQPNYFEASIGATFVSNELSNPLKVIRVGYRRMPPNGGFMFRAGICDLFLNSSSPKVILSLNIISIMPAISIGYAFKSNDNH